MSDMERGNTEDKFAEFGVKLSHATRCHVAFGILVFL